MKRIAMLLLLSVVPLIAQENLRPDPQKRIDFSKVLIDFDGKAMQIGDSKHSENLTLKAVAIGCLNTPQESDKGMQPRQSYKLGDIQFLIHEDKPLTVDEVSILVDRVASCRLWTPIVIRVALPLIDPAIPEMWK